MRTQTIPLGDIVLSADPGFASGENPASGVAQLRMNNVSTDGSVDWTNIRRVPADQRKVKKYSLSPGDILFNSTNSPDLVGKTALFSGFKETVVFSNHFLRIRVDREAANPSYVARWLSFCWKGRTFENLCTRWVNQASVRKGDLLDLEIPLPGLSEQRRIAEQLEQTDRLRRTRRYTLEMADTFLRAAFIEMFGDPRSNPKRWPVHTLGDVLLSAQDGPHVSPHYCQQGIPFLSTRNVRPGQLVWDDLKFISAIDAQAQWRKVKPELGDILYTKGGTTGMAKVVDFDKEIAVWVHIAVLKLRTEAVIPVWLEHMLNSRYCYRQSQELTFGIVNRDLGLKRMPRIRIYLPPLSVQRQFAALVERVEHLRAVQCEALRQAEHLFAALLRSAFSG